MHREDNSRFLLYIEPKAEMKSQLPIRDEITKAVETAFVKAKPGTANYSDLDDGAEFRKGDGWRGMHRTGCGKRSDNHDYLLENGMITNSLCTFYLQYYREAIPESEMKKVIKLINNES